MFVRNLRNLNLICLLLLENLLTFKTCRIQNLLFNFSVCQVFKLFSFFCCLFFADFSTFSLGISCRFIKKKTHNAAFFSIKSFSNNKSRLINIRLVSSLSLFSLGTNNYSQLQILISQTRDASRVFIIFIHYSYAL